MESDLVSMLHAAFSDEEQHHFVDSFHAYLQHDDNDFAISLDDVWEWIGFTRKDTAKRALVKHLHCEVHYTMSADPGHLFVIQGRALVGPGPGPGRPSERILMTVRGFKQLCMAAGTAKGARIRDYYVTMEHVVMRYAKDRADAQLQMITQQLAAAEERAQRTRHDVLVDAYQLRPVVYLAKAQCMPEGKWLLKIGETSDLKQRAADHRTEFGAGFMVMDVIECVCAHRLEQEAFRLPALHGRRFTQPVGRSQREQREVFLMDNAAQYKHVVSSVMRLRDEVERGATTRVQVMTRMEAARIETEKEREATAAALAASAASTARAAPAVLSNPDRRYTQARGDKVQRYSADGRALLATYAGLTEASRDPIFAHSCTLHLIKGAARAGALYKGFRWALLDRALPDDTVQVLSETRETRPMTRTYIAALSLDRTRVERVYCDMKHAAEDRQVVMSAVSAAVKRGTRCSGHYLVTWDACEPELREAYLASHGGALPDKRGAANGQGVLQLDPATGEVVRRFSSVQDVLKTVTASRATLKRAMEEGTPLRGFLWTKGVPPPYTNGH